MNHIINDDDTLDEWIREGDEPILSSDNLDWLDNGLPSNEEGRETIHKDDGATSHRVKRHTSNTTQEKDIDSCCKSKALRIVFQVTIVMMVTIRAIGGGDIGGGSGGSGGTCEGTGEGGGTSGSYVTQVDLGMSWAQGDENYYATQDTDHGY